VAPATACFLLQLNPELGGWPFFLPFWVFFDLLARTHVLSSDVNGFLQEYYDSTRIEIPEGLVSSEPL
jgi:hypothetical protein